MEPDRCLSTDIAYYEGRAYGLHSVMQTRQLLALQIVQRHHPLLSERTIEEIGEAPFTEEDARVVLAREHGFDDWSALAAHVAALADGRASEPFLEALESIKAGAADGVRAQLDAHPELVNARGTNGNRLLTLATSEGQVEIARLLLDAGADPDLPNNKGWTPLHAAAYGTPSKGPEPAMAMLRMYLDAGASVELCAHGDGGTALMQALFWGHRAPAELLAERGVVPRNLRAAAGLGRLDLVREMFDGQDLGPDAGAHREFHRPHSGFPAWTPNDDPQEIKDEALVYACKSGRVNVLEELVSRGANVDAEPYNGTPLSWACHIGHTETIDWLLDNGAGLQTITAFGGERDLTPLHIACWCGSVPATGRLVERGADRTVVDPHHNGTPRGWAEYNGHPEVVAYLDGLDG